MARQGITRTSMNRGIVSSFALAAGLVGLVSCFPQEYKTDTPTCFTGAVQETSVERFVKDVDNTGPYYASRLSHVS